MKKAFIVILSLWAHNAIATTCSDIGYYCPADGRYQRVQYIETDGTQYLDTGIPINSKYDMEMTWQNTQFGFNRWASGFHDGYGKLTVYLTGMFSSGSSLYSIAMYTIDEDGGIGPNDVKIPFDTNIHTTYCYKDKGIWIDDESTLKPADYGQQISSNATFLVGRTNTVTWNGRIYSFVFKDNGQTVAEFIPAYDTQAQEYGMYDTVSNKFFGNLGTGAFAGSAFPCKNAPEHAHYTGSGTDNNCPWECDTGYARTTSDTCAELCTGITKLRTDTISLKLYSEKTTHPSIAVQYKNQVCYVRMLPGKKSNALHLLYKGTTYHLTD